MKLSALIKKLVAIQTKSGDLEVLIEDDPEGDPLELESVEVSSDFEEPVVLLSGGEDGESEAVEAEHRRIQ